MRPACPFLHEKDLIRAQRHPVRKCPFEQIPCLMAGMQGGCRHHWEMLEDNRWNVPEFRLRHPTKTASVGTTEGKELVAKYNGIRECWEFQASNEEAIDNAAPADAGDTDTLGQYIKDDVARWLRGESSGDELGR